MSEIEVIRNCEKCGADLWTERGYMGIAGLCEECIAKLDDKPYRCKVMYKEMPFRIVDGKYNIGQLWYFVEDCERIMHNLIQDELTYAGNYMAFVITDYSKDDKIKELNDRRGRIDIQMKYFFTNDPYDCLLNYEDKDKHGTVIWNKNIKQM